MILRAILPAILFTAVLSASACSAPDPWNPADPTTGESIENSLIQCLAIGPACTGYSAIDPSALTNLSLWLRADSLTVGNGFSISTWADGSGNGHDASQLTGGNQPTFAIGALNGLPAVRFAAVNNQHMTITEFMDSSSVTAFHVAGNITSTGSKQRLFNDLGTAASEWFNPRIDETGDFGFAVGDSAGNGMDITEAFVDGFAILTTQVSGPSILAAQNGTERLRINGSYNSQTTWDGTNGPPTIGGTSGTPTDSNFNGDILEIIVVNRALDTDERRGVECYRAAKYDISVSHGCR